jgi:hypothetical protein
LKSFISTTLFLITSAFCFSQEASIFKIIASKGSVLIDDVPVAGYQEVYVTSKKITIKGKESYVGILTAQGLVYKFDRGTHSIHNINSKIRERISYSESPKSPYGDHEENALMSIIPDRSKIFSKEMYLIWKNYETPEPPYKISITDLRGEESLMDTIVSGNSALLNIEQTLTKSSIMIEISDNKNNSISILIQKIDSLLMVEIENQLKSIKEEDEIEKRIAEIALFDIHDVQCDVLTILYKLSLLEKQRGLSIQNNYYQRLIKKYSITSE